MFFKKALLFSTLLSFAFAAPPTQLELQKRVPQGSDPSFTLSQSTLQSGFNCPTLSNSISLPSNLKYLLLFPGTGTTGSVSWDHTWVPLSQKLGYTPCYISPPPNMLGDLQDASEYAVYAINKIYSATGKKVPVMTWSAGGLVAQWSMTFFPSTRKKVDRLIAHAPDYHGTIEAYLLTSLQYIEPSIWQQTTFSHFITALENAGGTQGPFVPTTNMYSSNDEIVQPETPNAIASSYLPGASNFLIQDVCGPLFILEHSQELFNQATYSIASTALMSNSGSAPQGTLTTRNCSELPPSQLSPADFAYDLTIIPQAGANILADPKVTCEPTLRPYAQPYNVQPTVCFINPSQSQTYANSKGFSSPFSSVQQVSDYIVGNGATVQKINNTVNNSR